jgi:hypothetical protein
MTITLVRPIDSETFGRGPNMAATASSSKQFHDTRELIGPRSISRFSGESLNRGPCDSEYIDVLTARRRQHIRTARILCERPGAEHRRRLLPDIGHHRDDLDESRPSAEDLDLVLQFAARLRAERATD